MQQYLPLKRNSAHLGDEYYRCLNQAITRDKRHLDECLEIALQYREALQKQRQDLSRFPDDGFVRRESELIDKYLELVERDLNSLSQGEIDKIRRQKPNFDQ